MMLTVSMATSKSRNLGAQRFDESVNGKAQRYL